MIGAAKAGTTSLHEYLRTHPELFLPAAKEQPFFNNDEVYERGWDEYVQYAFGDAPSDRLWGKATPQYLGGPVRWRSDTVERCRRGDPARIVPARIAEEMPDAKLVVLLREPVERAVSHQRLSALRGADERPLDEALRACLEPKALTAARIAPKEADCYVVAGEYARLLDAWLKEFPRDQLLVISTHRLSRDPRSVLRAVWEFLGVDESHVPANLGVRYNPSGTRRRLRSVDFRRLPNLVRTTPGLRAAWSALPPKAQNRLRARYRAAKYRFNLWNRVASPDELVQPAPEVIEALTQHYEPDLARLAELVGPVPGVTGPD